MSSTNVHLPSVEGHTFTVKCCDLSEDMGSDVILLNLASEQYGVEAGSDNFIANLEEVSLYMTRQQLGELLRNIANAVEAEFGNQQ